MNWMISVIGSIGIFVFIYALMQHLGRIAKHLRIIRLQLEIQNPLFVSEELLELDKNIKYWREKMLKYKDRLEEKDKDIGNLTFDLFWCYVDRLNRFRIMLVEAKHAGDPTKIHEKYRKWLSQNEEKIREMEKKAETLDIKINEDLQKRSLDYEFLGKWDRDTDSGD